MDTLLMNPTEFIDIYILELFQTISKEDKTIMLMGDFNIDLLIYDTSTDSATFLDSVYINFLLPIYFNHNTGKNIL